MGHFVFSIYGSVVIDRPKRTILRLKAKEEAPISSVATPEFMCTGRCSLPIPFQS
jgi:hypothetical protein